MVDGSFWRNRRVLVTGHTGFKGAWLTLWLVRLGARVSGISLPPHAQPNLFSLTHLDRNVESRLLDVRDRAAAIDAIRELRPEIVVHMAAQTLVRRSVRDPYETFGTNVVGLVNVLDGALALSEPPALLIVTSDKVYARAHDEYALREEDPLGGDDPYSASKACAEIVSASYRVSYGAKRSLLLCTARAGNVIGGGDWSEDRLIPDLVRAIERDDVPVLRNPESTRPWQHALDALYGYLLLTQRLCAGDIEQGAWNFGPSERVLPTVAEIAQRFLAFFGKTQWRRTPDRDTIERPTLRVDSQKARTILGWRSRLSIDEAISWSAQWYAQRLNGREAAALCAEQIAAYETR